MINEGNGSGRAHHHFWMEKTSADRNAEWVGGLRERKKKTIKCLMSRKVSKNFREDI